LIVAVFLVLYSVIATLSVFHSNVVPLKCLTPGVKVECGYFMVTTWHTGL